MLGSPGPDFKNPKVLGQATQNLYVDVDDVDKHHARAVKAGATIIEEPQDTPTARAATAPRIPKDIAGTSRRISRRQRERRRRRHASESQLPARRRNGGAGNDRHASDGGAAHATHSLLGRDEPRRLHRGAQWRVRLDRARSERWRGVLQGVLRAVRHRAHGAQELRASRRRGRAVQDLRVVAHVASRASTATSPCSAATRSSAVAALREEPGKDIWLWGGGELFGSLAAAGPRRHRRDRRRSRAARRGSQGHGRLQPAREARAAPRTSTCRGTRYWCTTSRSGSPKKSRPRGRACSKYSRTEIASPLIRGCAGAGPAKELG